MNSFQKNSESVCFGPFWLDLGDERLWHGTTALHLKGKAFAVLAYLVTHAGQLVTKDTLFTAVWPETAVSESVLTVAIRQLRRALEDDARQSRFIETVHGRGYRFIAPITPTEGIASASPPPIQRRDGIVVGRDTELAQMQQWLTTARHGERRIGFLAGEPGIGKTALVEAFVSRLTRSKTVWIGHGQCIEHYGAGEAYLPVLEALGRLSRAPDGARLGEIFRQYAPSWLVHLPTLLPADQRQLLSHSAHPITATRMVRELAEALEALTVERLLVLVLEDLHWSDTATLEWLAYMARRQDPARLLVLATYRPVEVIIHTHPLRRVLTELRPHDHCEEIVLDYLRNAAIADYLHLRLGGKSFPPDLAPMLHRRTTGNPLFLTSVVDELLRRNQLVEGDTAWTLPDGLEAISGVLPSSLRHLIEQHVEQLSNDDQALLEAASLVGSTFSAAAVAAALTRPEAAIEARCTAWVRQNQFLHAAETETWPDGTVSARYRFRHALYHEGVYARVSAGQRVRLHRQIAHCLETAYGDEVATLAAELAVHVERARDIQKAVHYLRQAADNAMQRSAHAEALTHLTKGLTLAQDLPEARDRDRHELALQRALGAPLIAVKGFAAPEVEQAYSRAWDLCEQVGETAERFPVLYGLWALYVVRAEYQTAHEVGSPLYDQPQSQHDPIRRVMAHWVQGTSRFAAGELTTSLHHLDQVRALYDPAQHPTQLAQYGVDFEVFASVFASHTLWLLGYPEQAVTRCQAALGLARDLSHPFCIALVLAYLTMLDQFRGDWQTAHTHAETVVTLCTEQGFGYYLAWGKLMQGWAQCESQQGAAGLLQMRQGLSDLQATGARIRQPYYLSLLAEACGRHGQVADGLSLVTQALAEAHHTQEYWWEAELHRQQGTLLLQQSEANHRQAAICFQAALRIARRQRANMLELRAAMSLARLWSQQGKPREARRLIVPIYDTFTEGFDTLDLIQAKALREALPK